MTIVDLLPTIETAIDRWKACGGQTVAPTLDRGVECPRRKKLQIQILVLSIDDDPAALSAASPEIEAPQQS